MLPLHVSIPTADFGAPIRAPTPDVEVLRAERRGARDRTYGQALVVQADSETTWSGERPRAQWEKFSSGPWRASAGLAFAAQLLAQEETARSPEVFLEHYPPAIRAYGRAALPVTGSSDPLSGLPVWI